MFIERVELWVPAKALSAFGLGWYKPLNQSTGQPSRFLAPTLGLYYANANGAPGRAVLLGAHANTIASIVSYAPGCRRLVQVSFNMPSVHVEPAISPNHGFIASWGGITLGAGAKVSVGLTGEAADELIRVWELTQATQPCHALVMSLVTGCADEAKIHIMTPKMARVVLDSLVRLDAINHNGTQITQPVSAPWQEDETDEDDEKDEGDAAGPENRWDEFPEYMNPLLNNDLPF